MSETEKSDIPAAIYLGSVTLNGFRAFPDGTELSFTDDEGHPAQWTVILGENGTAKTGLLQAISAMTPVLAPALKERSPNNEPVVDEANINHLKWRPKFTDGLHRAEWWISNRSQNRKTLPNNVQISTGFCSSDEGIGSASIELNHHFTNEPEFWNASAIFFKIKEDTYVDIHGLDFEGDTLSAFKIFSYAASRIIQPGNQSSYLERSVDSIFNLYDSISSPEAWLIDLDHAKHLEDKPKTKAIVERAFDSAKRCICAVLPDIDDIEIRKVDTPSTNGVEVQAFFKSPYGWVTFDQLGQGYQSMAGWAVDLLRHLHHHYGHLDKPETGPAVVLIDEFDLHLHPKWQLTIMQHLGSIFKNCQFIVTAHSPLLVQAAGPKANLIVLKHHCDDEGTNWIIADSDPVRIQGWRLDQIITSDLFGLSSAHLPQYEELFRRRAELVAKVQRTPEEDEELHQLTRRIEKEAPPTISVEAADLISQLQPKV